jgi:drug/metabolite transporter (DMT)-like permease
VVLLGEQLRPLQWLGAALALVSVVLINRRMSIWHPAAEPLPVEGSP